MSHALARPKEFQMVEGHWMPDFDFVGA